MADIRVTDPVSSEGSAAAAIDVGKVCGDREGMVPATMRHQSREEKRIFIQVGDKEATFPRRQSHVNEEGDLGVVAMCDRKGP